MTQPPSVARGLADLRVPSHDEQARLHRAEVRERLFGGGLQCGSIDRYRIVRRIGKGGGGIVYEALDPRMDRQVALKLVGRLSSQSHERTFLREAMLLAQIAHRAVVGVYDAGVAEEGAYIVMELVEGPTLADWLDVDEPRPWPVVLRRLIAAGQGLVACHDQGILHTDFKPSNVGLDASGAPKLLDFGLARAADGRGSIAGGTPPYMPPEQFERHPLDERADIYAFCVSCFRALWGVMPFEGRSVEALLEAKRAGAIIEVPRESGVPASVREVIRRGLCAQRSDRPGALTEVLDVFEASLERRRGRVRFGAGVVLAAVAGAASWLGASAIRPAACSGADDAWAEVYSESRARAVAGELGRAQTPYAVRTSTRVRRDLETFGERWRRAHVLACEARAEPDWDARVGCVEDRRRDLSAVLDVLEAKGAEALDRAGAMVDGLADPEGCSDPDVVRAEFPPVPAKIEPQVDRLRDTIARAAAQTAGGFPREGVSIATEAVEASRGLGHDPTLARALLVRAVAYRQIGNTTAATVDAEAALVLALATDRDRDTLRSAMLLFGGSGALDDGERRTYLALAEAMLEHGQAADVTRYLNTLGLWQWHTDDLEEAAATLARAARSAQDVARRPPGIPMTNLTMVLSALRRHEEAIAAGEESVASLTGSRGTEHPATLAAHNALGTALRGAGRYAEALEHFERLAAGREARLGPDSSSTIGARLNAAWARGDLLGRERVVDEFDDLIRTMEAHQNAESSKITIALARAIMARGLIETGALTRAEAELRRALDVLEEGRGLEHPQTSSARIGLALVLAGRDELQDARTLAESALEQLLNRRDAAHDQVLDARNVLARILIRQGESALARAQLRAVVAQQGLAGEQALLVAEAQVELARLGSEGGEAEAMARGGLDTLTAILGAEHPRTRRARARWSASPESR